MKEGIHPKYEQTTIRCACGEVIETGSTKKDIKVEICSKCHPFYTGKQKLVDTGGRVERFKRRFAKLANKLVRFTQMETSGVFLAVCKECPMTDYMTIRGKTTFEYEEKRSRFIATAAFADTEEKALAVLNAVRAANRTARHNVYAYVLQNGRTRYSDDGEPAKTAGPGAGDDRPRRCGRCDRCSDAVFRRHSGWAPAAGAGVYGGGLRRAAAGRACQHAPCGGLQRPCELCPV